ncbi:MAG: hypothetical protein AB8B96_11960 [Lysobacterales bacterium]
MTALRTIAATFFLVLSLPASAQEKCMTLECVDNQRTLAEDDLAFVRNHHDWLPDQVDEKFLQQLAQVTASLDGDTENPVALALALAKEGGAALLLDRKAMAIARLTRAATLLEKHSPRDASERVEVQVLLATAQAQSKNYDAAADATSRAQQVLHLNSGADTSLQLPLMYRKAAYLAWDGKHWLAEQQLRGALRIAEKAFGSTSDQAVEANQRLANHLLSTLAFEHAWTVYRNALKSAETQDGEYHPNAVSLMVGQAHAHLYARFATRAFRYFRTALATMALHPEHYSARDRVEMHHHFGQILMALHQENPAIKQFQSAWQLANDHQLTDWLDRFAEAELIPSDRFRIARNDEPGSTLSLTYRLSDNGRPRRVKPDNTIEDFKVARYAQNLLRNARFRPPIIDGEPVAIRDQEISIVLQQVSFFPTYAMLKTNNVPNFNRKPIHQRSRPAYNGRPIQRDGQKSVS